MKGYRTIKGAMTNPVFIQIAGIENKTAKSSIVRPASNTDACFIFNSPEARGLFFVRSICLSISLSAMSLTMHPADLVKNAPAYKSASFEILGRGAPARATPQHEGI